MIEPQSVNEVSFQYLVISFLDMHLRVRRRHEGENG